MFSDDKQCSEFLKNLLLDCSVLVLNIVLLQESITYKDYCFCDRIADMNEVLVTAKKFL